MNIPNPKPSIINPELQRPNWTISDGRDPNKLWLDKNENTDQEYLRLVDRVVGEIDLHYLTSYPDLAPLYIRLAGYVEVKPENLILAAGSDGVIRTVFDTFVCPGDLVIYPDPTFAMYCIYCRIYGAEEEPVPYKRSSLGPKLGVDEFIGRIKKSRARLVCLPNPNSPTGTIFDKDMLLSIITAASISPV